MGIQLLKKGRPKAGTRGLIVLDIVGKRISPRASLAVGVARNHRTAAKNTRSDRIFFVLKGQMVVSDGKKSVSARPTQAIFVPRNTIYTQSGSFFAVIVSAPAFDKKFHKVLK
jgi:mannose-6-phosphate isomerase-like protein (cupin superfamily)